MHLPGPVGMGMDGFLPLAAAAGTPPLGGGPCFFVTLPPFTPSFDAATSGGVLPAGVARAPWGGFCKAAAAAEAGGEGLGRGLTACSLVLLEALLSVGEGRWKVSPAMLQPS